MPARQASARRLGRRRLVLRKPALKWIALLRGTRRIRLRGGGVLFDKRCKRYRGQPPRAAAAVLVFSSSEIVSPGGPRTSISTCRTCLLRQSERHTCHGPGCQSQNACTWSAAHCYPWV